jgi:hypothetical protein
MKRAFGLVICSPSPLRAADQGLPSHRALPCCPRVQAGRRRRSARRPSADRPPWRLTPRRARRTRSSRSWRLPLPAGTASRDSPSRRTPSRRLREQRRDLLCGCAGHERGLARLSAAGRSCPCRPWRPAGCRRDRRSRHRACRPRTSTPDPTRRRAGCDRPLPLPDARPESRPLPLTFAGTSTTAMDVISAVTDAMGLSSSPASAA